MTLRIFPKIIILLIFFLTKLSAAEFPFEPNRVLIEGTLKKESFYGPPNYGETPEIDKKVSVYVIELKNDITVGTPESLNELNYEILENVSCIQINFQSSYSENIDEYLDKNVQIEGDLSLQVGPRDYYEVVARNSLLITRYKID